MSQFNSSKIFSLLWLTLLTILLLSGCGNRYESELRESYVRVQSNVNFLKGQLDNRQLSNALLIDSYATTLMQQKPILTDVARLLKQDATSQGNAFIALEKRLEDVILNPTDEEAASFSRQELILINTAADTLEYNNSLADIVNTLASLSDGQLPVINVPISHKAEAQSSNALVGNPSYGHWQQDNGGRSIWAWYGMYSMFNNVMGRNYYYDSWSSRPHYSYYGNYGRNRWGSNRDVARNNNLSKRYPSRYNKPTSAAKTRYASGTRRTSSYGARSSTGGKPAASRKSSYGSSSRSSSFSSSRSFRSGK